MDLDGGMALSVAGLWLDAQIDVDIEDIGDVGDSSEVEDGAFCR